MVYFIWYKNLGRSFIQFVTIHMFDGRTDGFTITMMHTNISLSKNFADFSKSFMRNVDLKWKVGCFGSKLS